LRHSYTAGSTWHFSKAVADLTCGKIYPSFMSANGKPFALVTGAAGFLGANLIRELVSQNQVSIVALDDLSGGFE
jgi:hypothetical protein